MCVQIIFYVLTYYTQNTNQCWTGYFKFNQFNRKWCVFLDDDDDDDNVDDDDDGVDDDDVDVDDDGVDDDDDDDDDVDDDDDGVDDDDTEGLNHVKTIIVRGFC